MQETYGGSGWVDKESAKINPLSSMRPSRLDVKYSIGRVHSSVAARGY